MIIQHLGFLPKIYTQPHEVTKQRIRKYTFSVFAGLRTAGATTAPPLPAWTGWTPSSGRGTATTTGPSISRGTSRIHSRGNSIIDTGQEWSNNTVSQIKTAAESQALIGREWSKELRKNFVREMKRTEIVKWTTCHIFRALARASFSHEDKWKNIPDGNTLSHYINQKSAVLHVNRDFFVLLVIHEAKI